MDLESFHTISCSDTYKNKNILPTIDDVFYLLDKGKLKPKIPTKEEARKNAEHFYKPLKWVTFLDYSEQLKNYTFPFFIEKIPNRIVEGICDQTHWREADYHIFMKNFLEKSKISSNSFFMKLISVSPKDYLGDSMQLTSIQHSLDALTGSIRCFEDLVMLKDIDKAYIVLRPYINIVASEERRVFVKDKKICGISQYFYDQNFHYSPVEKEQKEKEIRYFIDTNITPNMQLDDYVADVVTWEKIQLLETNPFWYSDPCLFKSYQSLDGSFLVNER